MISKFAAGQIWQSPSLGRVAILSVTSRSILVECEGQKRITILLNDKEENISSWSLVYNNTNPNPKVKLDQLWSFSGANPPLFTRPQVYRLLKIESEIAILFGLNGPIAVSIYNQQIVWNDKWVYMGICKPNIEVRVGQIWKSNKFGVGKIVNITNNRAKIIYTDDKIDHMTLTQDCKVQYLEYWEFVSNAPKQACSICCRKQMKPIVCIGQKWMAPSCGVGVIVKITGCSATINLEKENQLGTMLLNDDGRPLSELWEFVPKIKCKFC